MRRLAVLLVLALGLAVIASCATNVPDSSGEAALQEGLTVLSAGGGSLDLAYRDGDHVIYLQALRGIATAAPYQSDPESPKWEIDARFVSGEGRVFYTRQGGDGWIDPSWGPELDRQQALPPTRESNGPLFALANEAAQVMRVEVARQAGAARAAEVEPEMRAVLEFAERASETFAEHEQRMLQHRDESRLPPIVGSSLGGHEVTYGTGGPEDSAWAATAGYYYIAVHDKTIYLVGKHSSTRLYQWQGYWAWVHDNANHGDAAGSMSQKCFLQYYEAAPDYRPNWTVSVCSTGYDWESNSGGHNCHDDTRRQMNDFVYGVLHGGSEQWCNDGDASCDISSWPGDLSGSPDCNSSADYGYHHPSRCGYNWGTNYSCPASWQGTSDGCDCGCRFPDGTGADPDCA